MMVFILNVSIWRQRSEKMQTQTLSVNKALFEQASKLTRIAFCCNIRINDNKNYTWLYNPYGFMTIRHLPL